MLIIKPGFRDTVHPGNLHLLPPSCLLKCGHICSVHFLQKYCNFFCHGNAIPIISDNDSILIEQIRPHKMGKGKNREDKGTTMGKAEIPKPLTHACPLEVAGIFINHQ